MFLALSAYTCLTQVSQVLNQSLSLWERLQIHSSPLGEAHKFIPLPLGEAHKSIPLPWERLQIHSSPFGRGSQIHSSPSGRGKVRAFT